MADQFSMGYALILGVDENKVPTLALLDVARDVAALAQVLVHPQRCAYPPANVKTISGPAATRQGILGGLDWLQGKIESDGSEQVTAVVYFSGHGWQDRSAAADEYYLIPYDLQERRISTSALRAADFSEAIAGLHPRRLLVILDCCHAAGIGAKELSLLQDRYTAAAVPPYLFMGGEKAVEPSALGKDLSLLAKDSGRAVLSSSQGSQRSYVRSDRTMSIFTYHLIEALTGHAQPDEGANEVLISDIVSYVHRTVPKSAKEQAGAVQEPHGQISGNFPVALLLGGKGLSKGEAAPDPLATPDAAALPRVNTGGGAFVAGPVHTGGGDFVGRDKNVGGDEVKGDKIGGDQFNFKGPVSGSGFAFGRGARATINQGINPQELEHLFAPLLAQVQNVPAAAQPQAEQLVQELVDETARGPHANDGKLAGLIEDLVELIPSAVSTVVSIFATPLLSGLAGQVTTHVLARLQRKQQ